MQCVGSWGRVAGDVWDWGLWRFLGAQRGGDMGQWRFWGAQRGSEIRRMGNWRITVKKQEIIQNDRKKRKILEEIKEKLRKLRAKGGENLWNDRKI